jgi:membrane protein
MVITDTRGRSRSEPGSRPIAEPLRAMVLAAARWREAGAAQLGAAVAFYMVFAIAPLLVVAIAVAGALLGPQAARGHIVGQVQGLIGLDAAQGVEALIESAWRQPHGGLACALGLVALVLGAGGVLAQLRRAFNTIGRVPPLPQLRGGMLPARLTAFAAVLAFGFLAIVSLLVSALLAALGHELGQRLRGVAEIVALLDVTVSTALLAFAFAALLRWLPDLPWSRRAAWCGGLCSALLFSVGKHLIGLYLARAGVASSYGAAGSLAVLVLWVYGTAQIVLYGAALAAVVDEHARARMRRAEAPPRQAPPPQAPTEPVTPATAAPTSLAAARSQLRPAGAGARRRPPPTQQPQSAVLLHFPDLQRTGQK